MNLIDICFLLAALYNDYADEDIPDIDQSELFMDDQPAAEPSASPSKSPVPPPDMRPDSPNPSQPEPMCPLPRKPARFGRRSPPINVTQLMRLAGGLGLAAALSAADAHTDSFGPDWEVPSERAGGESRQNENKSKANEITPSAAAKRTILI